MRRAGSAKPTKRNSSQTIVILVVFAIVACLLLFSRLPTSPSESSNRLVSHQLSPVPIDQTEPRESAFDPFARLIPHVTVSIVSEGRGPVVGVGQKINVHYTGRFTDGRVFDSSKDRGPFTFTTGQRQVIRGWDETIPLMRVGTKATIVIQPEWAYGKTGFGASIPPDTILVFDIEILGGG